MSVDKSTFMAAVVIGQFILVSTLAVLYNKERVSGQHELMHQREALQNCVKQNLKEPLTCFDKEKL